MTKELNVSLIDVADDTDLRSLEVKIGGKTLKTPFSCFEGSKLYSSRPITTSNILNEEYKAYSDETIHSMDSDLNYVKRMNQTMNSSLKRMPDIPRITIVEYRPKGENSEKIPNDEQIEVMVSNAYSFSDVTPIPSIPKVARKLNLDNFENFVGYIETAYNSIEIWNHKPIMGYIPVNLAPNFLRFLIDFYLDRGINSFYLDFDGTVVTSHRVSITTIKRQIKKRGYDENCYFHIVNAKYGKSTNNGEYHPAKELLGFGFGFDSLGGAHVGARRSKEFYEKLKQMKNIPRNTQRVLCIDDYGYYRKDLLTEKEFMNKVYNDLNLPLADIYNEVHGSSDRILKILNKSQQNKEAGILRTLLSERETCVNTIKHYESKDKIDVKDVSYLKTDKTY